MKIHPVAAELFHEDRQDEVNSRFSLFCERVKKWLHCSSFSIFQYLLQRVLSCWSQKTMYIFRRNPSPPRPPQNPKNLPQLPLQTASCVYARETFLLCWSTLHTQLPLIVMGDQQKCRNQACPTGAWSKCCWTKTDLPIRKIAGSNRDPETHHSEWALLWFSPVPLGRKPGQYQIWLSPFPSIWLRNSGRRRLFTYTGNITEGFNHHQILQTTKQRHLLGIPDFPQAFRPLLGTIRTYIELAPAILFPRQSCRSVKLNTDLNLVQRFRIHQITLPYPPAAS